MPLLLSGLRLVLRKVMEQHREHVHTVQYGVKVGFYPRDTRVQPSFLVLSCYIHTPFFTAVVPCALTRYGAARGHEGSPQLVPAGA